MEKSRKCSNGTVLCLPQTVFLVSSLKLSRVVFYHLQHFQGRRMEARRSLEVCIHSGGGLEDEQVGGPRGATSSFAEGVLICRRNT
eukprot:14033971-Ditylum_brightwellii.AAC.1